MSQSCISDLSRSDIERWVLEWTAAELGVPSDEIRSDQSLLEYSLSSVTATMLVGDLEDWLGLNLSPTLVWDYPSIDALVDHLVGELAATRPPAGAA